MLHADSDLVADGMWVQLNERLEQVLRLALVVPWAIEAMKARAREDADRGGDLIDQANS